MKGKSLANILTAGAMLSAFSSTYADESLRSFVKEKVQEYRDQSTTDSEVIYQGVYRGGYLICINDMMKRPFISERITTINPENVTLSYRISEIESDVSSWPYYFYLDNICEEKLSEKISIDFDTK